MCKIKTISGKQLREEFTAIEVEALKHAAEYCKCCESFTGVPTSKEERYINSSEEFTCISNDGARIKVRRESTGKILEAIIKSVDNKTTSTMGENTPPNEPQKTSVNYRDIGGLASTGGSEPFSAMAALLANIEASVLSSVMKHIRPLMDEAAANQKQQPREIVVKINENPNVVDGITHPRFERVIKYVANHKNVYLYGPAGSGKNVICEQVAKSLGVPFYYQNTILTKFDVTGYKNAGGVFEETEFFKAWTNGGVFMLDEADNATAEAMVTLNAALANGYYTFPGIGRVECNKKFYCVAAGNTNGQGATDEYCGRYKMDESSRDRFAFVKIDYATDVEEAISCGHKDVLDFVRELRSICKDLQLSLICGYRAINSLVMFYDDDPAEIIEDFILKGIDGDTLREVANRMSGENKFVKAIKILSNGNY